jgi:ABC-type cobalamin/Fe3+-siderophores transport system ATPase subunit
MPKKLDFPEELLIIENKDKKNHEKWSDKKSVLDFPKPYRLFLAGRNSCGKSTFIKNIIVRATPMFEEIVIMHCAPDKTREYDDIDVKLLDEIPEISSWTGDEIKTLCIIDDLDLKSLSKEQKMRLDRLFGYVSTHNNVSVIFASQQFHNIPSNIRRCCNIINIWKSNDSLDMKTISKKVGIKPKVFEELCDEHLDNQYSSLMFDMTKGSPAPIRKNGFRIINL